MIATPTFAPGQRVRVRIVATVVHVDALHGYTIDYMGARFMAPSNSLIEHVEPHMALFELGAHIIETNGQASFLVAYAGHRLRVHVQQIQEVRG